MDGWFHTVCSYSMAVVRLNMVKPDLLQAGQKSLYSTKNINKNVKMEQTSSDSAINPGAARSDDAPMHSFLFRKRGWIGVILLVPVGLAVSLSVPLIPHGSFWDNAFDFIGWLFFISYFVWRVWATMYVGSRKDIELQIDGPYSLTRNPLYLGSLCFALAAAFFFKSLLLILAVCAGSLIYLGWVIADEERFLERHFGEKYRDYRRRTPRLFPRFSGYRAGASVEVKLSGMRSEIKRLLPAAFLPFAALLIAHLRMAPWWPDWFTLP